jgi:hypothetical protein
MISYSPLDSIILRLKKYLGAAFVYLLLVNFFWIASSWPATMTPDSLDIWGQVKSLHFNDWHPVSYTLFVLFSSCFGKFVWLTVIAQTAIVNFSIFKYLRLLMPDKPPKRIFFYLGLLMSTPFFGAMEVTIWKDTLYGALILLGITYMLESKSYSRKSILISSALIGLGSGMRHEGWVVLLVVNVCVLFWKYRSGPSQKYLKNYLKISMVALIISVLIPASVNFLTRATLSPSWLQTVPLLHDLEYVNNTQPELLSLDSQKLLNQIASGDSAAGAKDCSATTSMIFSKGFNSSLATSYRWKIFSIFKREAQGPARSLLLYAHACRGMSFVPPPFSSHPISGYWVDSGITTPNPFNLQQENLTPGIGMIRSAWIYVWEYNRTFTAWPGLHLLILLILIPILVGRRKLNDGFYYLCCFAISRHFVLIVWAVGQDYRFAFITYLFTLPLLLSWGVGILSLKRKL